MSSDFSIRNLPWTRTATLTELKDEVEDIKEEIGTLESGTGAVTGSLRADVNQLKTDVAARALQTTVATLQSTVTTLQSNVTALQNRATALETDVTALKTDAIAFVFSGTPVIGHTINVPLTYNLSIPANLTGSSYRCATNPLANSVFTLSRMTSTGSTSTIGTINLSTAGAWSATGSPGSNALVAGDTLRLTATTVGGSLTNVGITIRATRR